MHIHMGSQDRWERFPSLPAAPPRASHLPTRRPTQPQRLRGGLPGKHRTFPCVPSSGITAHWGLRGGGPVSHSAGNQGSETAGHMPEVTQQVSNSSHATFPTPPPQMPSSEPLPTLTDTLSNHTQAAWGHRGHQGPDAAGSPLPHRGAQEDISQGSGCTCPQPGWIQPPQKQDSQPTCRVVPNLCPAVTPVRGPQ